MKKLRHFPGAIAFFSAVFLNAFVDLGHKIVIQNTLFKLYDEQTQVIYTAILNGLILLPFILLLSPAGFLSDKYQRVKVMRVSAWAAVVLCTLITLCYYMGWFWLAFAATFLLAAQSAIYSPAKMGFIKQLFGKNRLGEANGVTSALSIIAILAGIFAFSILFESIYPKAAISEQQILQAIAPIGWVLLTTSIFELAMTYRLKISATDMALESDESSDDKPTPATFNLKDFLLGRLFIRDLQPLIQYRAIRLSVIGLSTFWGVGQVMLAAFPAFFKTQTGIDNTIVLQGILACSGIGIALGSTLSGKVSRDHIELGLLPIGAAGIALGLFLLPAIHSATYAAIDFLFIGFMGGLFIVPLNALIQFQAQDNELGKTLAANNWLQNVTMLSFLLITASFAVLELSSKSLLQIIAWVALIGCAYTLYQLPQSFTRFILSCLLSRQYRVKVQGMKNVPANGGALLLGNHTSYMDWAVLQLASPRQIRFVMIRNIYERWYLKWFFDLFGCIPIEAGPRSRSAIAKVNELLKAGELVCLFPEGTLTRTGHLAEFRAGFEKACIDLDRSIPIIPFYQHGLWGSQFSRASDKLKSSQRLVSKRDIVIAFGEPMDNRSNAQQVKQQVFDLSVDSWDHYVETLSSIPKHWVSAAKFHSSKPCLADSSGVKMSAISALSATSLLGHKLSKTLHGQNIGILLPASGAAALVNMAVLQCGKSVVNINYSASDDAIAASIALSKINTVVTSRQFIQRLQARSIDLSQTLANCHCIYMEDIKEQTRTWQKLASYMMCRLLPARILAHIVCRKSTTETAAILFSSGSEGTPKGICLSHKNIMANVKQTASVLNMQADDTIMANLPPFHAFGLTITQFLPLLESIPVVYHPDPTDAYGSAKIIAKYQATILFGTSTFFRLYNRNKKVHPLMLASLRTVVSGAEKLQPEIAEKFKHKFGSEIYEGYGATETTPVASVNIPDKIGLDNFAVQQGKKPGSVGMPLPGSSCKIVDPYSLKPLPTGEHGMILIGGSQVMLGYLDNPDKSAQVITYIDGKRWYISGDKGYLDDDGFLYIVDRYSRFAKIGGEMISLSNLEYVIGQHLHKEANDNPDSSDIEGVEFCATNIPDDKKGEQIILVTNNKSRLDLINVALTEAGVSNLALPSKIIEVVDIPKLGSGKVNYSMLKKIALGHLY